jgi:hypothetical protein
MYVWLEISFFIVFLLVCFFFENTLVHAGMHFANSHSDLVLGGRGAVTLNATLTARAGTIALGSRQSAARPRARVLQLRLHCPFEGLPREGSFFWQQAAEPLTAGFASSGARVLAPAKQGLPS